MRRPAQGPGPAESGALYSTDTPGRATPGLPPARSPAFLPRASHEQTPAMSHVVIKTPEQVARMRVAGRLAAEAFDSLLAEAGLERLPAAECDEQR